MMSIELSDLRICVRYKVLCGSWLGVTIETLAVLFSYNVISGRSKTDFCKKSKSFYEILIFKKNPYFFPTNWVCKINRFWQAKRKLPQPLSKMGSDDYFFISPPNLYISLYQIISRHRILSFRKIYEGWFGLGIPTFWDKSVTEHIVCF